MRWSACFGRTFEPHRAVKKMRLSALLWTHIRQHFSHTCRIQKQRLGASLSRILVGTFPALLRRLCQAKSNSKHGAKCARFLTKRRGLERTVFERENTLETNLATARLSVDRNGCWRVRIVRRPSPSCHFDVRRLAAIASFASGNRPFEARTGSAKILCRRHLWWKPLLFWRTAGGVFA